jgi:synaptic vesicle membrane protein VAT-1
MDLMRHIVIDTFGAASTLKVRERSITQDLSASEVAIRVNYSGINFADVQMRLGFYPDAPKKPFVPGYEVSGVVHAIGSAVSRVQVGDAVVAGTYFGGYASQVTVPEHQVFPLPSSLDLAQGAAMPVNLFTAHLALFEMARVRQGDRVLIECATGGVGTLAVQMALRVGADVIGLTTTAEKLGYIESLGAKAMTRDDFEADPSISDFDFILNASGGSAITAQKARLAITGRMVCMGLNSGVKDGRRNLWRMGVAALRTPRMGILSLMNDNAGVFGLNALKVLESETWVKRLSEVFDQVDDLQVRPHVDQVFDADSVAEAHRYLETKQARGKILLAWS